MGSVFRLHANIKMNNKLYHTFPVRREEYIYLLKRGEGGKGGEEGGK